MKVLEEVFPNKEIYDLSGHPPLGWRISFGWARIKHLLGIHSWVVAMTYDHNIKRMIDDGKTCLVCHEDRWE